jgi:hypothetical protein
VEGDQGTEGGAGADDDDDDADADADDGDSPTRHLFRARSASFGTATLLLLLHAYNCKNLAVSLTKMTLMDNKVLFWYVEVQHESGRLLANMCRMVMMMMTILFLRLLANICRMVIMMMTMMMMILFLLRSVVGGILTLIPTFYVPIVYEKVGYHSGFLMILSLA